jgi:hypothetical protein
VSKKPLKFVETGGGAFILLPLELRKTWEGAGDDPEDPKSHYARTKPFAGKIGVLKVGAGSALILGTPEESAFWPLPDGGLFVQRIDGDEDEDVQKAVEAAIADKEGWAPVEGVSYEIGDKGRLAFMDSALAYADAEKEERIEVQVQPGTYTVETKDVEDEETEVELHLVRLKKS